MVVSAHDIHGASRFGSSLAEPGHSPSVTGQPRSDTRAKHLKLAHANPVLHARRLRVCALLRRLYGEDKQVALAAKFGVSRTLAMRWLEDAMVDKNPAPLAILYAVDEESFEEIVRALRTDREQMREGL